MSQRYVFGPFKLDERERRLTRQGQVVHLQPKSFEVLLYLLEHAGKLVEKNEVIDAVWKEAIVTENSLTVCIRQIRIALEDHADAPGFIETIPASGYRFIADVAQPDEVVDVKQQQAMPRDGSWLRRSLSFAYVEPIRWLVGYQAQAAPSICSQNRR